MKPNTLKFTVTPQPTLFTHQGKEYYLVNFQAVEGLTQTTHREPKAALDAAGHIPAVIRGKELLRILEMMFDREDGWVTLYDCREDMHDRVGYFNALPLSDDGLCFYHVDHGGGPGEHPALCERKVKTD